MANETGTVELPIEETTDADVDTQAAIERLLEPKAPQKSEEQEIVSEEEPTQVTEQPSETEPEAPAAETEEEPEDELPADVQARIQKRIDKVVAKRKELEEQLAERETKMAEMEARLKELSEAPSKQEPDTQTAPGPNDPLLQIPDIKSAYEQEQKATQAVQKASELLRKFRKDPEAALTEFKELTKLDYDAEDAKDWLAEVKENAALTRTQFAQKRVAATERHVAKLEKEAEKFHNEATKAYPEVLDKNSKMGKRVHELSRRFQGLLDPKIAPDGFLILLDIAAGQLARESKVAAPAAPKVPPPKLATVSKATIAPRTNGKPAASTLRKQALETGNEHDIDRALEAIL